MRLGIRPRAMRACVVDVGSGLSGYARVMIGRVRIPALAVAVAAFIAADASDAQARLTVTAKPSVVKPGGTVRLTIRGTGATKCGLNVRRNGRVVVQRRVRHTSRLPIATDARAGVRTVSIRCGKVRASTKFTVRGTSAPQPIPTSPGTEVLTATSANAACAAAFGRGSNTSRAQVIPRRRVLLFCGQLARGEDGVVAYDVDHRTIAWQTGTKAYEDSATGEQHFFLISSATTPASGLQPGHTTYTVNAVDLVTGRASWRMELPIAGTARPDSMSVVEGLSGVPDHALSAVVSYGDGTTSYDAVTGALLWHVPRTFHSTASGSYVTAGVVEVHGLHDNAYGEHLTGFDARTGNQLWDLRFQAPCTDVSAGHLTGIVEWRIGRRCMTRHDVATGQLLSAQPYPPTWQEVYADPNGLVAWDGASLAFYRPDDLATPVWAVPAGATTPLAISSGHILVSAPSGALLLSRADGSVSTSVSSQFASGVSTPVRDGLVTRFEVNGDVSVLSMDAS